MTPSQLQFSHPITGKAADIISQECEPIECNRNRYERCTLSYPPITYVIRVHLPNTSVDAARAQQLLCTIKLYVSLCNYCNNNNGADRRANDGLHSVLSLY